MNIQTIEDHATGAMKHYIMTSPGTEEGVSETMQTVPTADVWQEPSKVP